MANPPFPTIQPTARAYVVSGHPTTTTRNGLSGRGVVFLHAPRPTGLVLDLQIESATSANITSANNHYAAVKQHGWFTVPADIWLAHDDQFQILPWYYKYKYAGPPVPTKEGTSPFYTLSVRLSVFSSR